MLPAPSVHPPRKIPPPSSTSAAAHLSIHRPRSSPQPVPENSSVFPGSVQVPDLRELLSPPASHLLRCGGYSSRHPPFPLPGLAATHLAAASKASAKNWLPDVSAGCPQVAVYSR